MPDKSIPCIEQIVSSLGPYRKLPQSSRAAIEDTKPECRILQQQLKEPPPPAQRINDDSAIYSIIGFGIEEAASDLNA